jgi:hypothetical protein
MRLLWLVGVVVAACSKPSPPAKSCERGAKLELRAVDSDSDYMKHVFAHVGSLPDGSPTDQAAIDNGIHAEIDQWQTDIVNENNLPIETRRVTDYYLTGGYRDALERYIAGLEAPPADREIVLEHKEKWRTYYVVKTPVLDTSAVADVRTDRNKMTGQPTLLFTLTRDGQATFTKATTASVGKKQAFLIDGVVMSVPIINEPIKGGHFGLNMADQATAEAMRAKFQCVK